MDFDTSSLAPIGDTAATAPTPAGGLDLSSLAPVDAAPSQTEASSPDKLSSPGEDFMQLPIGALQAIPSAVTGTADLLEKGMMDALTFRDSATGENRFHELGRALGIVKDDAPTPAPYEPQSGGIINKAMDATGLNPNKLPEANGPLGRILNMVGQGAILAAAPEAAMGDAGLLARIGSLARPAAVGAVSGAAGQGAAEVVPEPYKPLATAVGAIAGGMGMEGALSGARAAGRSVGDLAAPFTAKGQKAAAAAKLAGAADSSPSDLIKSIDSAPSEIVPGSKPTTFQQTGDLGLGGLERGIAAQNPEMFAARRAEQNSARLDALDNIQADGHPEAVADTFRQQMADIDQQTQSAYDRAQQQSSDAVDTVGAPAASDTVGTQARTALQTQLDASKAQESALWKAVDPDNSLTVLASPVKRAVQSIYGDISPELATGLSPAETKLAEVVNSYGPTLPFSRLTDLRSVVSEAMRAAKSPLQPNAMAYGRLAQLRGSIEDAISDTVQGTAAQEQHAVASGAMAPEDTLAARWAAHTDGGSGGQSSLDQAVGDTGSAASGGAGNAAGSVGAGRDNRGVSSGAPRSAAPSGRTSPEPEPSQIARDGDKAGNVAISPSGYRVSTRPEIVDASTLDKATGDLQVRDRTRHASDAWIERTASGLDPDQLMPSVYSDRGAPIVGADNIVDSGNGRMAAIRRAAQAYPERYEAYKQSLRDAGFNVPDKGTPVLISRRTTDLSPEGRAKFNADSNGSAVARMSSTEIAQSDRAALTDDVLRELAPGPVTSGDNRAFINKFLANLGHNEAAALVDKAGHLNADGVRRVENALVASAYGDVDKLAVERFAEATDDNTRSIVGAMADSAGPWAQMRRDMQSGETSPVYDVTPHLTDALRSLSRWRAAAASEGRFVGHVIREGLGQLDMLSGEKSPEMQTLVRGFYKNDNFTHVRSREDIADFLQRYVNAAREVGRPSMFGEETATSPLEVLNDVTGRGRESANGAAVAGSEGAVQGNGGNAAGADREVDRPRTFDGPLIDQAAADRLSAASGATKSRKEAFGAKPVASILQRPGATYPYTMAAERVPDAIWRPGAAGGASVKAFVNAAKSSPEAIEALRTMAASSLRTKAGASLTPESLAKWRASHSDALSELEKAAPGTVARFDTVERATDNLATIARQRKEALDAMDKSAIGKIMKVSDPADVTKTIGAVFGRNDSVKVMKEVADAARKDPAALEGLRKSIVDFMQSKLIGNTEAGTSGRNLIKSDQFQTFFGKNRPALRQVFSDEELNSMQAVAQDLARANRSITAVKLPGGSNTAQDTAAIAKHNLGQSLLGKLLARSLEGGGALGGGVAGAAFGPLGSVVGGLTGLVGVHVVSAMRASGMQRIDDLVRDAMLDPDLAKTLLMKAPKRPDAGSEITLAHKLAKLGALGGVMATQPPSGGNK